MNNEKLDSKIKERTKEIIKENRKSEGIKNERKTAIYNSGVDLS